MTGRLKGKTAIVVGAGSSGPGWGNGKAAAVLFAREGASVLCVDRSPEAAQETAEIVAEEGNRGLAHVADVTDPAAVEGMVEAALAHWGRIDVLQFNVGILEVGGPEEVDLESWQRVMEVNLTSLFLTCRKVLPVMVRQFEESGRGGTIVTISSISGIRWTGIPYISYSTSKAGMIQFTRSLALQYARQGIRANCILPGLMDTPMIREPLKQAYGEGDVARMLVVREAQCPMGVMGDAWDVARASLFLASDDARYITGTELVVDGGITAKFA